METEKGIIVCIFLDRGYGFIRSEDGRDLYFNRAGCCSPPDITDLREGLPVEYTVVGDDRGRLRAIGIVAK